MYAYLRGTFRGSSTDGGVLLEVGGIGFEVLVPPIVEQALRDVAVDDPLTLYVSAQSGRDQPWPQLFGFLRPEEKAFWELLKSVPRVGGKGAARAMSVPIAHIAGAIQEGNKAYLDGLPGVTLDGAARIIASLQKKVAPFVEAPRPAPRRVATDGAESPRDEAVQVLVNTGVKRADAERAVDDLLASRDDLVTTQDLIAAYFRAHGRA